MRAVVLALATASLAVPVIPGLSLAEARSYNGRIWQDSNGRYRCKRPDGTVGLIVGGAGGALIGRAIDTKGERATGMIVGAAAGALMLAALTAVCSVSCEMASPFNLTRRAASACLFSRSAWAIATAASELELRCHNPSDR